MALGGLFKKGKKKEIHEDHRHDHVTPHAAEEGEGNWLVSYADLMTLLCGFFVMMFSMASLDKPKFDEIRKEIAKEFKGEYVDPSSDLKKELSLVIQELGLKSETVITSDSSGVSLTFESAVFFVTGSAEVSTGGQKILNDVIQAVEKVQTLKKRSFKVVVEGHSDRRPIVSGNFASNWELSGARSARVVRYFIDHKFDPTKLLAIGYADTRPKFKDRTPSGEWDEAAMAKNRRVVIRVLHQEVETVPWSREEGASPAAALGATAPTATTGQTLPPAAPAKVEVRTPAAAPVAAPAPASVPAPVQKLPIDKLKEPIQYQ